MRVTAALLSTANDLARVDAHPERTCPSPWGGAPSTAPR